jgi:hypothetical protein
MTLVAVGMSGSGYVGIWENVSRAEETKYRQLDTMAPAQDVVLSPDSRYALAATAAGTVYVFRLAPPPRESN